MEAIILAGGMGTRLSGVIDDVPKPLAPVGGRPFLDYLLMWLASQEVTRVVLSIGYKGELIMSNYGSRFGGLSIEYCTEEYPLGTGGAIKKSVHICRDETVLVLNGDSFYSAGLSEMRMRHMAASADVTVAVKEMKEYDRYGTVIAEEGVVTAFYEKQHKKRGLINCGVYVLRRKAILERDLPDAFSFERDFLQKAGLHILAVQFEGGFIDIGTPEDYALAQTLLPQWVSP